MKPSCLLRWEHPSKHRYYQLLLSQDLFGDWIITKSWGKVNRAAGQIAYSICRDRTEAKLIINRLTRLREKSGYVLQ